MHGTRGPWGSQKEAARGRLQPAHVDWPERREAALIDCSSQQIFASRVAPTWGLMGSTRSPYCLRYFCSYLLWFLTQQERVWSCRQTKIEDSRHWNIPRATIAGQE
jgi:hypothetical protein